MVACGSAFGNFCKMLGVSAFALLILLVKILTQVTGDSQAFDNVTLCNFVIWNLVKVTHVVRSDCAKAILSFHITWDLFSCERSALTSRPLESQEPKPAGAWPPLTHILDLPRNSDSLLSLSLPQTSEIQVRNHSSVGMNRGTTYNILNTTFHFHALEKEMATHASILAWRIPGMAEPGGLPSTGSHRVRHNWSDSAAAAANKIEQPILWQVINFKDWFFSFKRVKNCVHRIVCISHLLDLKAQMDFFFF